MINICVTPEFRALCPSFRGIALLAEVKNSPPSPQLWQLIDTFIHDLAPRLTADSIKTMPAIHATREAYKAFGKEPSRYRPSGEQLLRRVAQGKGLYRVSTLVDILNLASLESGYSIGGFDAHSLVGTTYSLGVGKADEPYEGIGRGQLNIAGMPAYRDALGAFATPTSDSERTKITPDTSRLLVFINGYDGNDNALHACAARIAELLEAFAHAVQPIGIQPY